MRGLRLHQSGHDRSVLGPEGKFDILNLRHLSRRHPDLCRKLRVARVCTLHLLARAVCLVLLCVDPNHLANEHAVFHAVSVDSCLPVARRENVQISATVALALGTSSNWTLCFEAPTCTCRRAAAWRPLQAVAPQSRTQRKSRPPANPPATVESRRCGAREGGKPQVKVKLSKPSQTRLHVEAKGPPPRSRCHMPAVKVKYVLLERLVGGPVFRRWCIDPHRVRGCECKHDPFCEDLGPCRRRIRWLARHRRKV